MFAASINAEDRRAFERIRSRFDQPEGVADFFKDILARHDDLEVVETVYETLRLVTYDCLVYRRHGEMLDIWSDIALIVQALVSVKQPVKAERFGVLADLLDMHSRLKLMPS